jgi:hypothetical protein
MHFITGVMSMAEQLLSLEVLSGEMQITDRNLGHKGTRYGITCN